MKESWPTLLASVLYGAFIAISLGAVLASHGGQTYPHGLAEYWFHRYQTLVAGAAALFSAVILVQQIRTQRNIHRSNMRLALRKEYSQVDRAFSVGHMAATVKLTTDNGEVKASMLNGVPLEDFPVELVESLYQSEQVEFSAIAKLIADGVRKYADTVLKRDDPRYASMANYRLKGYAEGVQNMGQQLLQIAIRKRRELDEILNQTTA